MTLPGELCSLRFLCVKRNQSFIVDILKNINVFQISYCFIPGHYWGLEVNFDADFAHDIMTNDHVILMWSFHHVNMEIPFDYSFFMVFMEDELSFALLEFFYFRSIVSRKISVCRYYFST